MNSVTDGIYPSVIFPIGISDEKRLSVQLGHLLIIIDKLILLVILLSILQIHFVILQFEYNNIIFLIIPSSQ